MKRLKKWRVLIVVVLAVTLVIGWKEKRCQSQTNQCRASYISQLSTGLTVEQQASAQQAIAAACEPDGYFCRLFSPANLPSMFLVFIGICGIYAAIKTLRAIEKQTDATVIAANAAKDSADALINSERAWILLDRILPAHANLDRLIPQGNFPLHMKVSFKNYGRTPAWIVGHGFSFTLEDKSFRPPDRYTGPIENTFGAPVPPEPQENWEPIPIGLTMRPEKLSKEELQAVIAGEMVLILQGVVIYRDTFSDYIKKLPETSICLRLILRPGDGQRPTHWLYYSPEANRHT